MEPARLDRRGRRGPRRSARRRRICRDHDRRADRGKGSLRGDHGLASVNVPSMSTVKSSVLSTETPLAPWQLKLPSAAESSFFDIEMLHSLPISPAPLNSLEVTKTAAS